MNKKTNSYQQKKKQRPVMAVLKKLQPNQTATYPIRRLTVVKSTASMLGTQFDVRFTTKVNRDSQTITVTRL